MSEPWTDPRVEAGLTGMLHARRQMCRAGAAPIGWKVGLGAPPSLELMGISAPLVGFLTDATVVDSGATVEVSEWSRGIVEFEVAVYLGSDVPGGADPTRAAAAVDAVGPAIELANINLPMEAASLTNIAAGNIFHETVILGDRDDSRAGLDVTGLRAGIMVDGVTRVTTSDLQAITGPYPWIVAIVANTLAAHGELLRAGDVIITGSIIPPVPLTDGTEFTFALEPFDPISVSVG
jgi:2-keto-4-pentenoate hydratase